ncbi:valacyclovir hydrolase [Penicillium chrysogenum]|uniref:valacyclovir hydrolase n=1 Tax=Penicillium chrysogenum TaxID=5076 RepID=UPI00238E0A5E|nr:valacyclovir hydrolase [Penicillium chrysogenum]KAJ5237223.1 valacyclovir hydrolase [Penicillium chrysogenum]KAJ5277181.1 valacyclovir hydrolase [Penicillium chrysogenum]KAJ6152074.1 valacyclovir hydrolase [Penicillium chrysogenum]
MRLLAILLATQVLQPVMAWTDLQSVLSQPACHDSNITVHVSKTTNRSFVNQVYDLDILYALAGKQILVSNSYSISSRLCEPSQTNTHSDTLQVMIHGASFNKNMWDSQYQPETYSWVQRMNKEGYYTLAVDLIGNGNSTFPDGLLEAQTQTYVETTHQLIQQIRNGTVGGRRWRKVVIVGFSIGAIVANSLAQQYPEDMDAIVLHGISWDSSWIYPAFLAGLQAPAPQIDPARWGQIPATYQTQSTREGRKVACFAGSYDENILEYDWNTRDFDSMGAAVTFVYHLVEAPKYTGPVFLGIGDRDATFCGGQRCGSQPYALYDKFPSAIDHDINLYPETGHLILFRRAAPTLMADSLAFLRKHNL